MPGSRDGYWHTRPPSAGTTACAGAILTLTQHNLSFLAAALVSGLSACWCWRRLPTFRIPFALAAMAAWALVLAPGNHGLSWSLLPLLEWGRYAAWLYVIPVVIPGRRTARWLGTFNLWAVILGLVLAVASPVLAVLGLAFAALVNVEQLLRAAEPEHRAGAKLCALALGAMFAYDLFSYSEFLLIGNLDSVIWRFRGFVNAALVPVLTVGVLRLSRARSPLFVSRQAVFYSTAFLAVGIYLLVIAAIAQYLKGRSGVYAEWLQPLLLVGAALVLVALLASDAPWRKLRVFLAKHFYRNKYDYRVEWLRFVRNLGDSHTSDARVAAIRAIAHIFEAPGAALYLRDPGDGVYGASGFWSAEEQSPPALPAIPVDHPMIQFMSNRQWVLDMEEYRRNPRAYDNLLLPNFLVRADSVWRVASPLFDRDELQGLILLQQPPSSFTMTYEDRDLLQMVGRHVATLLAQQAADRRLAESRQFDAFNRFAAFVMHDLKNSVAQLQLLASNAKRHRHNPEFIDDAFATIENTSKRIGRLIAQLQASDHRAGLREARIGEVLATALGRCSAHLPRPVTDLQDAEATVMIDPDRLAAVFEHVLRNAQDAAGIAGDVRISSERTGGQIVIIITDTGPGMEASFIRERLFRPFDSTKTGRGMGIGAYQVREYVRDAGGTVEVQSAPGSGTRFIIRLPLCQNRNPAS